jgi:Skp family chaperone for outer membrane proteins
MNESYEELLERLEAVRKALLEEIEKIQKDLEAIRQEHGLS